MWSCACSWGKQNCGGSLEAAIKWSAQVKEVIAGPQRRLVYYMTVSGGVYLLLLGFRYGRGGV